MRSQNTTKLILTTFTSKGKLLQRAHFNHGLNMFLLHRLHSDVMHIFTLLLLVDQAYKRMIWALRTLCTGTIFHTFTTSFTNSTNCRTPLHTQSFTTFVGTDWGSLPNICDFIKIRIFNLQASKLIITRWRLKRYMLNIIIFSQVYCLKLFVANTNCLCAKIDFGAHFLQKSHAKNQRYTTGQHLKCSGIFYGTKIDMHNTLTHSLQHSTIGKSHFMIFLASQF